MSSVYDPMTDALRTALEVLRQPDVWWQVGIVVAATVASWLIARLLIRSFAAGTEVRGAAAEVAASLARRVTFLVLLGLSCVAGSAILQWIRLPHRFAWTIALLAFALAVIRLLAGILKRVLQPGPLLTASEHAITWSAWLLVAMYLLGWIDPVSAALDSIIIPIGKEGLSLLGALKALLTLLVFLIAGAWLGAVATRALMGSTSVSIGLRVGIAKFVRLFLLLLASLLGLHAVGIDLAALTVFGGALGIGLGFGLQRIAANFVSGFILVGDRSIRQGDVITIGDRFGVVKELRARYIVVRDRDGVETLIPNENVISAEVVNWSYSDRAVRLKLPVQISYKDKPRQAMELLLKAAAEHPRVLKDPAPASRVMAFEESGILLELRFWIQDPEDGINNVRSDLHLAIWDLFSEAAITIPYPQRDVHLN